jgi:hypothetical protein
MITNYYVLIPIRNLGHHQEEVVDIEEVVHMIFQKSNGDKSASQAPQIVAARSIFLKSHGSACFFNIIP